MNIEELRDYCLDKKEVTESFPFDETTLVFKVMGKMFLVTDIEDEFAITIKVDPEIIEELREQYPAVSTAPHFSKKHWNKVLMDTSIDDQTIKKWIDESYVLVVKKLPKKQQQGLL